MGFDGRRCGCHTEYQLVHNGPVDIFRHMPNMFRRLSMRMRVEPCLAESGRKGPPATSHVCTGAQGHFPREPDRPAESGRDRNRSGKTEHHNKKTEEKKEDQKQERKTQEQRQEEKKPTPTQETQQEQEHSNNTPKPKPKHKKKHDGRLAPGCAETAVNGGFPTKLGSVLGV